MTGSFYTRGGDDGTTGLLGPGRVGKEDIRIEAVGAVDEAGAALGLARASSRIPEAAAMILQVQRDLYGMMAELAATPENAGRFRTIDAARVSWLEAQVDAAEWSRREPAQEDISHYQWGFGRELFSGFRSLASGAEQGAMSFGFSPPPES